MMHSIHRGYFKILFLCKVVLLCCLCKNTSYIFTRIGMFYLKQLYSKILDIYMVNREWQVFFRKISIRWQFIILDKLQISLIKMLYFIIILMTVMHLSQWAVTKLCFIKELSKRLIELMLIIFWVCLHRYCK